jgi:hypothetical protein
MSRGLTIQKTPPSISRWWAFFYMGKGQAPLKARRFFENPMPEFRKQLLHRFLKTKEDLILQIVELSIQAQAGIGADSD